MKPNAAINIIVFFTLLVLGVSSCVKPEKPPTVAQQVSGVWVLNKIGTDDKGNGVITLTAVDTSLIDEMIFNNNGTGKETTVVNHGNMVSLNFTWSESSDSLYRIGTGHENITYFINNITGSTMYLIENTTSGLVGLYYVKK